jgi:hypothetical protein
MGSGIALRFLGYCWATAYSRKTARAGSILANCLSPVMLHDKGSQFSKFPCKRVALVLPEFTYERIDSELVICKESGIVTLSFNLGQYTKSWWRTDCHSAEMQAVPGVMVEQEVGIVEASIEDGPDLIECYIKIKVSTSSRPVVDTRSHRNNARRTNSNSYYAAKNKEADMSYFNLRFSKFARSVPINSSE